MKHIILICMLLFQAVQQVENTYEIHGSVLDPAGGKVAGAGIELVGWDGELSGQSTRIVSGADGHFAFDHLAPGKYRLYVWKESAGVPNGRYLIFEPIGKQYQEITIRPQLRATPLVLKLPDPYGTVNGRIVDSESQSPVPKARIRLERSEQPGIMYETDPEADGRFLLRLPARPIKILVTAPGYQPWVYQDKSGKDSIVLQPGTNVAMAVQMKRK